MIEAWLRKDGRKGIRNVVAVAYLVECAHHVARRIVDKVDDPDVLVHVVPPSPRLERFQPLHSLHPVLHGADHHGLGRVGLGPDGRQHQLELDSCNVRVNDAVS